MKQIFQNLIDAMKSSAGQVSVEGHGGVQVAKPSAPVEEPPANYTDEDKPRLNQIRRPPLLAVENGELVMAVDHVFENIPSWVEWDPETLTLSIAEMNGTVNEAKIVLEKEHLSLLVAARKILLVSNDKGKGPHDKILHYVAFLPRNA